MFIKEIREFFKIIIYCQALDGAARQFKLEKKATKCLSIMNNAK